MTDFQDWNGPPHATCSDARNSITFLGVGRVMTCWESLEFELSRTYSVLCGDPDGPSTAQYGAGRIFRDRRAILSERAERYFTTTPNQELEGDLCAILRECGALADRRNEVAHGIVMAVNGITHFRDRLNLAQDAPLAFLLIPPLYLIRRHDQSGHPDFSYSSIELRALGDRLITHCEAVRQCRADLLSSIH